MLIEESEIYHSSDKSDESLRNDNKESFWLTTKDNPFNPFTQFEEWLQYDTSNLYNSSGLLARIAKTSSELSDKENGKEIHRAMAWIVANDPEGKYLIVTPSDF